MFVLERLCRKTNTWGFVYAHEEKAKTDYQFNLCCSQFPQGDYRVVQILTFRPRTEDEDGKPVIG